MVKGMKEKELISAVAKFLSSSCFLKTFDVFCVEAKLGKVKDSLNSNSNIPDLRHVFNQWEASTAVDGSEKMAKNKTNDEDQPSSNGTVTVIKKKTKYSKNNEEEVQNATKPEVKEEGKGKKRKAEEAKAEEVGKKKKKTKEGSEMVEKPEEPVVVTSVEKKSKKKLKKQDKEPIPAEPMGETFVQEPLAKEKKGKKLRKAQDEEGTCQQESTAVEEGPTAKEEDEVEGEEAEINGIRLSKDAPKSDAKKSPGGTTLKAFQRVKVEEVTFKDERLMNNSYWAKGGADSGWGAKAQEILGQVRGKDFRHEKTKKKRGSYKGGAIDLGSHSIKFEDSDEE